jgi:predicted nucleotidyltransferase
MTPYELVSDHTIYSCVVGSRAYGLAGPESDIDRRGIYLAPTPLFWTLGKPPSHVEGPAEEQFSWELERFCELGIQANPTTLECLWSPLVETITPAGEELIHLRSAFLSRRVAQSYGGYAQGQWKRLEAARMRADKVKWKQAMHMLRLLMAGAYVMGTHEVLVDVSDSRDRLLAVKRGELSWVQVRAWASTLERELDAAEAATTLPDEPDLPAINDFLVRTRLANL